jgi:hypothetical protein
MQYTVFANGITLGAVDLPIGSLVAARMNRFPGYASVAAVVRDATEAFLHLGLFTSARSPDSWLSDQARTWIGALARASELRVALIDERGDSPPTQFVNLLESPVDHGIVVLASFVAAATPVGAARQSTPRRSTGGASAETRHTSADELRELME